MGYLRLLMNSLIDCNSTAFTINAEYLLSDKGYDSDEIIKQGKKPESPKRIRQIYTS